MITAKVIQRPAIYNAALQDVWSRFGIGVLVFTFILLFASKDVYMGHFLQTFDPFLLAFLCFFVASIFYHISYFSNESNNYLFHIKQNLSAVLWLNLSTAVSWLGGFYALKFIEPSIAGALNFSISPVIVVTMAFLLKPKRKVYLMEIVSAMVILSAVGFLIWASLNGLSSVGTIAWKDTVIGLLASLLAGIAIAGNTVFSKRLSEAGLSAAFVLSSRFYLLIVSALVCWKVSGMSVGARHTGDWFSVMAITFLGVITPLYILQKVIERLEPITISFIIIIRPMIAYLLEYFDPRLSLSPYSLLGVVTIVLFIFLGIVSRHRSKMA